MKKIIFLTLFLTTFFNNINAENILVNILVCEILDLNGQVYRDDTLRVSDRTLNYKIGDKIFLKSVYETSGHISNFKFKSEFDPSKDDVIFLPTIEYIYYRGKLNPSNEGVIFNGYDVGGTKYDVTFLSDFIYVGSGSIKFKARKHDTNKWTASYVNQMSFQVISFISTCEETGDKVDDFISIFKQIYTSEE